MRSSASLQQCYRWSRLHVSVDRSSSSTWAATRTDATVAHLRGHYDPLMDAEAEAIRAAWSRLSKEERRDYRRAMLGGRRASSAAVAGLVVQVADRHRSQIRWALLVVVVGTVILVALVALDQTLAPIVIPALFLFVGLLLVAMYFGRVTRHALAANLPAVTPSRPDRSA